MKKEYLSPEVEIICFAPVEELASGWMGVSGDNNDWITVPLETDGAEDGDGEG